MGAIGGSGVSIEEALPLDGGTLTGPLTIDQDGNSSAIVIDSESTTVDVLDFGTVATTTGNVINMDAGSLTTGRMADLRSNSSSASARFLVNIVNDNTAAIGAVCLALQQDAANHILRLDHNATAAGSSYIDFQGVAAANVTNPVSTLTTSGAIQGHLQIEVNGVKRWLAFLADPS